MNNRERIRDLVVAVIAVWLISQPARGGFIDVVPDRDGVQSVSWAEPSAIMVFIPAQLAGADRMNFEMGIRAVVECLRNITVQFKDGDPPNDAVDFIDVNIENGTPPPYGQGGPFVPDPYPANQNHVHVNGGQIDIDAGALGHAAVAASMMKNLGAHEFAHALGLDHDPTPTGPRQNVMDPNFNLIFDITNTMVVGASPFVDLSASDKMMLREHYRVVPEPVGGMLFALGLVGMIVIRSARLGAAGAIRRDN